MLHHLIKDYKSYFLPFGIVATLITYLMSFIPGFIAIAVMLLPIGYSYSVYKSEQSFTKTLNPNIIGRNTTGAFIAAFLLTAILFQLIAAFLGTTEIETYSITTQILIFFPPILVLGIGTLHTFNLNEQNIYSVLSFLLGGIIVWILFILFPMITSEIPRTIRIFLEMILVIPALCFPAWLAVYTRETLK